MLVYQKCWQSVLARCAGFSLSKTEAQHTLRHTSCHSRKNEKVSVLEQKKITWLSRYAFWIVRWNIPQFDVWCLILLFDSLRISLSALNGLRSSFANIPLKKVVFRLPLLWVLSLIYVKAIGVCIRSLLPEAEGHSTILINYFRSSQQLLSHRKFLNHPIELIITIWVSKNSENEEFCKVWKRVINWKWPVSKTHHMAPDGSWRSFEQCYKIEMRWEIDSM